jgi:Calx-beta domain
MNFKAHDVRLERILGIVIITALLSGCGQDNSASSASSATGASSSGATSTTAAVVELSSASYTAAPSSNALVTINRSGSATGSTTVGYTTVNGTATSGADYTATSGTVTWNDGESGAKTVTVPVMSAAAGKNFSFALTSIDGQASFGTPAAATVAVGAAGSSSGTVTLSWAAPTENTNGSALTNLAGYDIYYGTSPSALTQKVTINSVAVLSYVISDLSSGTWYFEVKSVNTLGVQSVPSNPVSTSVSG